MSLIVEQQKHLDPVVPWEDITCLLWHNGMLFSTVTSSYETSTGCNGKVNVWDKDLNSLGVFQAHDYGIYHMCAGPEDTIYTCASDSTICHWQCLSASSSLFTFETNKFRRLSILKGHLEPPWKLQFFKNRLFSGDELGEIRLWENDCYKVVLETYEEIWDMIVIPKFLFTVRHLDVTVITIPEDGLKKACSVQNTIPGRGPLFVSGDQIICLDRKSYDILVYSINETGNPLTKTLKGHSVLVNSFAGNEDILLSGDYDGKIIAWELTDLKKYAEINLQECGCINAMVYDACTKTIYVAQEKKRLSKITVK